MQPGRTERVSNEEPRADLPCAWCRDGVAKDITINEVWSQDDPTGRLVRLCADCCAMCAG